jgi:hypothetical protein
MPIIRVTLTFLDVGLSGPKNEKNVILFYYLIIGNYYLIPQGNLNGTASRLL